MPFSIIFLFGVLASCFALMLELLVTGVFSLALLFPVAFSPETFLILFGIALIEEASKCLFLWQYAARFFGERTLSWHHILLLGVGFGSGFAVPEILLAAQGTLTSLTLGVIGILSLHLTTSLILSGAFFACPRKCFFILLTFLAAILLHMLYNTGILFFL